MAEIKPFKAVHYNSEKVKHLAKVVCPPYDIISPEDQDTYYNRSEYNFIRIHLSKSKPKDDEHSNKYTRAKETFEEWLKNGILIEDDRPCIYFYKQEYAVRGEKYTRLGFISLMKLPDEEKSKVFPHENTHSQAKEDRLQLWSNIKANCSSIFVCFSDYERKVEKRFAKKVSLDKPFIDIVDDYKVRHMLWRLADPKLIQEIGNSLNGQQLFIADGHHRYEVAQQYRKIKMRGRSKSDQEEPFNYLMTYFTNMDSKNLQIFPIHRIVKKFPISVNLLEQYFRIDKVKTKN